jgi:hypothetical protein
MASSTLMRRVDQAIAHGRSAGAGFQFMMAPV